MRHRSHGLMSASASVSVVSSSLSVRTQAQTVHLTIRVEAARLQLQLLMRAVKNGNGKNLKNLYNVIHEQRRALMSPHCLVAWTVKS